MAEALLNLNYTFDRNLQEVLTCPRDVEIHVEKSLIQLKTIFEPFARAKALGQVGVFLRQLRRLDEAEFCLREAIQLGRAHGLREVFVLTQEIRLAHVVQWKLDFEKSSRYFDDILERIEKKESLKALLDFAYQHAGKNYFDQKMYAEALTAFERALDIRHNKKAAQELIESSLMSITETQRRLTELGK